MAGFIVKYAPRDSELFEKGVQLAREAAEWFIDCAPVERHIAECFIELYKYCKEADAMPFDEEKLLSKLDEIVDKSVCRDVLRWSEYMPRPSAFISSHDSRFYTPEMKELCRKECEYIINTQLPDGSYEVPWQWYNDYKERYVAENWCKAGISIDNMLFLREFCQDWPLN